MAKPSKEKPAKAKANSLFDRRYEWVPAGQEYYKRGGLEVYVKYGRTGNSTHVKEKSSHHVWIVCPDRELVIVCNGQHVHSFRPMQGTFDEMYTFSPFHEPSAQDLDYHYVMVNYTEYMGKEGQASKIRMKGTNHDSNIRLIADSGGFQIWREDVEYIDPLKLVQWYNENVDYGMILDIPSNVRGVEHFTRLANVQAKNTQIMMDNRREDLELFNVFHGMSPDEVKAFRDITERDDINRLAIGGGYWGTVLASISRWCGILTEGRPYDHYHILGVQNVLQTLPIMKMVQANITPNLVTSDSTTHIQNAVSKNFYFHPEMVVPPRYMNFGYKGKDGYKPSAMMTIPCNCPVCAVVKYKDVYSLGGNAVDQLMTFHNLFATQKYLRSMNEFVQNSTTAELKEMVKVQFASKKTKRSGVEEMLKAFDFIDHVAKHGLKSARKAFAYYLPDDTGVQLSNATLFSANTQVRHTVTPKDDPAYIHMDKYASRYEQQQGNHGKKIHKKGKVSAIQSVTSVSRTGKKKKLKAKVKKKKVKTKVAES